MTDEMLDLARANQERAGVTNAEFLRGRIEEVPLPDHAVDVIVSNCVINLSSDKPAVFAEAHRLLRAGGRLAVADVVADAPVDEAQRGDLAAWTDCIAGAITRDEYRSMLEAAGFVGITIDDSHPVADGFSFGAGTCRHGVALGCEPPSGTLRIPENDDGHQPHRRRPAAGRSRLR
jgi:SAM-dependent methyltransferase